jgi:hypothetical protein
VVHTANFHAGTHGGKDIPESITWSILLMLCVLHARYDSAIPSTVGQLSTNIRTSANLARAAEKHTASRRLRTRAISNDGIAFCRSQQRKTEMTVGRIRRMQDEEVCRTN